MKKIYLIDGNSFIYRMYFALPEFSTSGGRIVNATFGIAKFFLGQLRAEKPDYVFFIRDAHGDNFRHQIYAEYKATRDRMPDSLRSQIEDIQTLVAKMGFESIEIPGYEADDVIATLVKKYEKEHFEIFILSGDKDLHALVNEKVKIYDTLKKQILGVDETREKFGIHNIPFITDYLAIAGDSSDNIPGIAGIGPAKAVPLLNEIGSVEEIYQCIEKIRNNEKIDLSEEIKKILSGKTLEKLIDGKDSAFLSKRLATLDIGVDISHLGDLENFRFTAEDIFNDEVKTFFKELEFFSLLGGEEKQEEIKWGDLGLNVTIVGEDDELEKLEQLIQNSKEIAFDTETTSLSIIEAELVGVSIYIDDTHIYYINRLHRGPQVSFDALKQFLKNIFTFDILIIGHNLKYDKEIIQLFLEGNTENTNKVRSEDQASLF